MKGQFSNNFDSLVKFVDEGIFTLIEKRDSSYLQYDRTYRIDMLKEVIVVDTLGLFQLRTHSLKTTIPTKKMAYLPINGLEDSTFQIKAEIINKNGYKVPVLKLKFLKIFCCMIRIKTLLSKKNETISVDGVNGPEIILGSLSKVSTNGNWPTIFDAKRE